jgi:hypothetical protein
METEVKLKILTKAIVEIVLEEEMQLTVLNTGPIGITYRSTQIGDIVRDIIGCSAHVVLRESKLGEKTLYRIVREAGIYSSSSSSRFAVKTSEGGEFGLNWHISFSPLLPLLFGNCLIYRCLAYEMPKVKYDNSKLGLIMNDPDEHSLSIFNTYATIP